MMEQKKSDNPWIGLRAYVEGETIYGRDNDIVELSMYVLAESEVVLYGKSGTGKSSIINAGVLPSARRNGFMPIKVRLEHKDTSLSYLDQIRKLIDKAGVIVKEVVRCQSQDHQMLLWEFFHCNKFYDPNGKEVKLLIIFDQFEEIFTIQNSNQKRNKFFGELADLLNNVKPRELCASIPESEQGIVKKTEDLSNDEVFSQLEEIDFDIEESAVPYVTDNCVHFVFTLREDYLSDFEYYTALIPSLKQHRYAFRPINVQQATEIIMKPRPGLISKEVAEQIIGKISKSVGSDSEAVNSIDTPILSLFLSQLYQRLPEDADSITSDMLDEFGDNIINEYYITAISDTSKIRPSSVEWIEKILLTQDSKRDNKDINDVLDKNQGLTKDELEYLEKEKKILTRFRRSGSTRIEFVHDVIAEVAAHHKISRQHENDAKLAQTLLLKKANRKLWATYSIISVISLLLIWALWKLLTPTEVLPPRYSFVVSFLEDSLTTENDYWKGTLNVYGKINKDQDTLLLSKIVDKGQKDSIFVIETDSLQAISFKMNLSGYSQYQNVDFEKDFAEITKIPNIQIKLNKIVPVQYPYYGQVVTKEGNITWPIQNALVCLHDKVTRTDSLGNFKYYLEREVNNDDELYVIKKGFNSSEFSALGIEKPDSQIHTFVLTPKDSIKSIELKVAAIDSIMRIPGKYVYRFKKRVVNDDNTTDSLILRTVLKEINNGLYVLEGYCYLKKDMDKLKENNNNKLYAYYVLSGTMEMKGKSERAFSLEGINYLGNSIKINGFYESDGGDYKGEISSPSGYHGVLISKKEKSK